MPAAPPSVEPKKPAATPPAKAGAGKDTAKAGAGKDTAKAGAGQPAAKAGGRADSKAPGDAAGGQQRLDRLAVRAKLAVSEPGDAVEREADAVADRVMRMTGPPGGKPAEPRVQDSAAAAPVARPAAAPVKRQAAATPAHGDSAPDDLPATAQALIARLGAGEPLDAQTQAHFETRLGRDLGEVRIHTDAAAARSAAQIHARAFTWGGHVAFASGEYQPGSEPGQRLLAHELAHVLQHADGTISRALLRKPAPPAAAGGGGDFEVTHAELEVPPIKARHLGSYTALAGQGLLKRKGAYDASARGTKQVGIWTGAVKPDIGKIPEAQRPSAAAGFNLNLNTAGGAGSKVIKAASLDELTRLLQIPTWDAAGNDVQFQVDHMVEYQLGGADAIENMELLNQAHNGSVGSSFSHGIKRTVSEEIQADPTQPALAGYGGPRSAAGDPTAEGVMAAMTVVFRKVKGRARESARKEGGSVFWSRQQIEALDPVLSLLGDGGGLDGTATRFALLSPTGNLLVAQLAHGSGQTTIAIAANQAGGMAGFTMKRLVLNAGYNDVAEGSAIGSLEGALNFGPSVAIPPGDVSVGVSQASSPGRYSGKLGSATGAGLPNQVDFKPMSPLQISGISFGQGVFGQATLQPSHPALAGLSIPAQIQSGRLGLSYTVDATALAQKLKIPGVSVDSAAISLAYDGSDFSVGGGAEFTISKFGSGFLNAAIDSSSQFELNGGLRADPRLFDEAHMDLWYRSRGGFGGRGTLAITKPGKIKGLKRARLNASYADSVFSATGEVVPDIPGLKAASLTVRYADDALDISGKLAIDDKVPGVEKADITVTLSQADDGWKVGASGQVTPKLPGLSGAQLAFSYDDGLVLLEGEFSIEKGPLDGKVRAGVTNAEVDDKGQRAAQGGGGAFKVFGAADIDAVFIEDKLYGKLKLRLLPDGSVRVGGGLKSGDFEVFGRFPKDGGEFFAKTFETPPVPLPGLGFSVGSVSVGITFSASVTASAHASIGPGKLSAITLTIDEFDPAQVDFNTLSIGGGARFEVFGDAGFGASAQINLIFGAAVAELVGSVGAEAKVGIPADQPILAATSNFTFSQAKGLDIQNQLTLDISPELTFRLFGEVSARLNLLVDTVTVWSKNWTLAEANYKLPVGIKAKGQLGYNSKTGKISPANPADAITVERPTLDASTMKGVVSGDTAPPSVKTVDDSGAAPARPGVTPRRQPEAGRSAATVDDAIAQRLGSGMPLDLATRGFFEQRLQADFSPVRLHTGPAAAREAERLSAKAFSVGEHIAFADGEFRPSTPEGRELLAHELAHVSQQQRGAARQLLREETAVSAPAAPAESAEQRIARARRELEHFVLPASKRRHGNTYRQWFASHRLRHGPDYDRSADAPAQIGNWEGRLAGLESQGVWARHFARLNLAADAAGEQPIVFAGGREQRKLFADWVGFFKRPQWNHSGEWLPHRLEVDHVVELQVAGWPGSRDGDAAENYELLDKSTNASSGSTIHTALRQKMRSLLAAEQGVRPEQVPLRPGSGGATSSPDAESELRSRGVVFTGFEGGSAGDARGGGRRGDAGSTFWVLGELQSGEHLEAIHSPPAAGGSTSGSAGEFVLLSAASGGIVIARLPTRGGTVAEIAGAASRRLASLRMQRLRFDGTDYGSAAPGVAIGTLEATWQLPAGIQPASPDARFTIVKPQDGRFNGFLQAPATIAAEATALSPIEFGDIALDAAGIDASGQLRPSLPLLGEQAIDVTWTHDDIRFARSFTAEELSLSVPGVSLDAASLTVFFDRDGFGAEGAIFFTLAHLGTGSLNAGVDGAGRFSAEGSLDIDTRVFDEANLRVWYRAGEFGGAGRIAITRPGRIRGVDAASIEVSADSHRITARGDVQPALPGVRNAALTASYAADEGLVVGGELQLADIAGIREGSVHAELRRRDAGWSVAASGRAVPALPGVAAEITVNYDDGTFDGQVSADYEHGIFAGSLTVGLTNRAVGADGEIVGGDSAAGGDALVLYGSGSVTARLTDWLQGGIGVAVRPSGDLLISGSLGIADAVTVFEQVPPPERATRTLFSMPTVSVPLVGLSVGSTVVGVALTINGRVTGHAQVGPGRLTRTELRIDDFNPAQPDTLHVTGDAEFDLPAEAGVAAQLDAGVSLGAAVINATAGLELSAGAVLAADVAPHVALDWRPAGGLHLHADLNASLSPRLAFDLNGYAEVVANAFVTTFSLWRKDWNLAHREIGSSLALRLNLPVDYYSDGRGVVFDPQRVSFEVPSLNADTLDRLLNDEGGAEHVERGMAAAG